MKKTNKIESLKYQCLRSSLILLMALFCAFHLNAQGWERTYDTNAAGDLFSVVATPDYGFLAVGSTDNSSDIIIIKVDPDGQEEWSTTFGSIASLDIARDVVFTDDGGYVITGTCLNCGTGGARDIFLIKTDAYGNHLWTKTFGDSEDDEANALIKTSDGGFMITGSFENPSNFNQDVLLIKTDAEGEVIWQETFGGEMKEKAFDIIETSGSDYVLTGYTETPTDRDLLIMKVDVLGDSLWSASYGNGLDNEGYSLIISRDNDNNPNGYVMAGYTQTLTNSDNVYLVKTDLNGNEVWTQSNIGGSNGERANAIIQTDDQGFAITGFTDINAGLSRVLLVRTDSQGTPQWSKTFGDAIDLPNIAIAEGLAIENVINDCGFLISGYRTSPNGFLNLDAYLIKTDCQGNIFTNYINGNVFEDLDSDCNLDTNEPGFENWFVQAVGDNKAYYSTTDADGNYSILCDTGSYELSLVYTSSYYTACVESYDINLNTTFDTVYFDFAVEAEIFCPDLVVDVATDYLVDCDDENTYTVYYCNRGTIPAEDAIVDIELEDFVSIVGSTLPYTDQGNNLYTFDLGNISTGVCDTFQIHVNIDCDATLVEQTNCVFAHIYPDTICSIPNASWDGSSISVNATCEGDEVLFEITNNGQEDMNDSLSYFIVEDDVILFYDQDSFQLDADSSLILSRVANGSTYRLFAEQSPGHPGNSFPTIAIEGCDADNDQDYSVGFVNQFAENDNDPFISVDCQEIISQSTQTIANNKRGYPKGYGDEQLIPANTDLKYHITFQNVTNDTAIRVVIRDTLSSYLDPSTVIPGTASHDYNFEVYGEGILKFTFENIMLPDSSTTEEASTGFVKFRVSQKPNNPDGTEILNSAAITIDVTNPILTPKTVHRIGGLNWEDFVLVNTETVLQPDVEISVYPNPFSHSTTFEVSSSLIYQELTFSLYDLSGRLLRTEKHNGNTFQFDRNNLPAGMYIFRLDNSDGPLSVGKIIAR